LAPPAARWQLVVAIKSSKMAAICSQKAAFAGKQVAGRRAVRTPAGRSSVAVQASANRNLWAPGVVAPEYLNGSLAGDYGFGTRPPR
jgi:light-harvesting complex I chlorophyll a/b binding protein 4